MSEPSCRVKHRFSAKRFKELDDSLNDVQKGYVINHGFGDLLGIANFHVPIPLIEWVMDHLILPVFQYQHKDRSIKFTRSIVANVLGLPCGDKLVDLDICDADKVDKVNELKALYITGQKCGISEVIDLTLEANDEESFTRSFMLVALSTIICPSTQNFVNLRYLNCLTDVSQISEYDWAGHVLQYMSSEVMKYQCAVQSDGNWHAPKSFYVGSCLPLLAIVYMDYIDLNNDIGNHLSYCLPRICHVSSNDFEFIMKVDRNRSSQSRFAFGALSFRHISSTPYYIQPVQPDVVNNSGDAVVGNFSGINSSAPLEAHRSIKSILDKHQELLVADVNEHSLSFAKSILPAYLKSVIPVFAKWMSLMCAEIYSNSLNQDASTSSAAGATAANDDVTVTPQNASEPHTDALLTDSPNIGNVALSHNQIPSASNVNASLPSGSATNTQSVSHVHVSNDRQNHSHFTPARISSQLNDTLVVTPSEHVIPNSSFGFDPDLFLIAANALSHEHAAVDTEIDCAAEHLNNAHELIGNENVDAVECRVGSSTLEKKQRKKRHEIYHDSDDMVMKLRISTDIEDIYKKYVVKEFIAPIENVASPVFVLVSGFHCDYHIFRSSLKPKGRVFHESMDVFVPLFNLDFLKDSVTRFTRKKISFSTILVAKLLDDPNHYDPESNEAEFTRINAELDMISADLFFFPACINDHWVLICINYLFKEINFFDPADNMGKNVRDENIRNLVSNFQRTCVAAGLFNRDFIKYRHVYPPLPKQISKFDCGINVMLFMDCWNGKELKHFDLHIVNQFRKLLTYKLITCPLNEVDPETIGV